MTDGDRNDVDPKDKIRLAYEKTNPGKNFEEESRLAKERVDNAEARRVSRELEDQSGHESRTLPEPVDFRRQQADPLGGDHLGQGA